MKRIDCGLTAVVVFCESDTVTGVKPPWSENFQTMSRWVSVWSLSARVTHPLHMTKENMGFRMARTLLRSRFAGSAGGAQAGGSDQGMSKARAFSRTSVGLQPITQRLVAGSAWMWCRSPVAEPTVTHSPPVRTLKVAW